MSEKSKSTSKIDKYLNGLVKCIEDTLKEENKDTTDTNTETSEDKVKHTKKIELSKLVNCISIVIYVDQCGHRNEELSNLDSTNVLKEAIKELCKKDKYLTVGVVHNRGLHSEKLEDVESKVHSHIMFLCNSRTRITTILKDISDVVQYDYDLDWALINNELKVVNIQKNQHIINYVYFAHDTCGAIADGKEYYGYDDIITNVDEQTLIEWRSWYESHERGVLYSKGHRNSSDRIKFLMQDFYKYGLCGESFKVYRNKLVFEDLSNRKLMEELERMYNLGLDQYLSKRQILTRCSIYIYSDAQVGKSTNCYNALDKFGERPLVITKNSKTGALDSLDCKQSLIYDDRWPESCLDIADDMAVNTWRRNSNNRCFNGNYLVILSNQKFDDFFKEMSVDKKALYSRFFVVQIKKDDFDGISYVYNVENECTRGDKFKKAEMFYTFMEEVVKQINIYHNGYYFEDGKKVEVL